MFSCIQLDLAIEAISTEWKHKSWSLKIYEEIKKIFAVKKLTTKKACHVHDESEVKGTICI